MADDSNLDVPQAIAVPRKRARISIVWIIPILAALVAVGIAIQRISNEGPTISIVFRSAQGIEAGKSFIKYKEVNIGQVTAVQLSGDFGNVEVTAKIAKSAAGLMVEDARFWVVRPRISVSEISGLNTLLSGSYIGFEAGRSHTTQRNFTGLEVPQIVSAGVPGREFALKVNDLGGLTAGAPVYYRRVPVGQVISYNFSADGRSVDLKIFVNAPYDTYVHPETRFWNASGLDVSLSATGLEVRAESLAALLSGGIAFDTPSVFSNAAPAAAQTVFTLHRDRATAMKQPDSIARRYVLHFSESLHGLSVGAPVTFLGLTAGEVTAVGLTLDPVTLDVRPRVDITLYPERLIERLPTKEQTTAKAQASSDDQTRAILRHLVDERGMRAQIRSASLLTGQRYVAMEYFPTAPRTKTNWSGEVPELPVAQGTLPDVEEKVSSILRKIDKLPLESIGANLNQSMASLDLAIQDTRKLLGRLDVEMVPELKTTLEDTRRALVGAERVMNGANAMLVGPDAPAQQQLRDTLQEVTRAARAIRLLADSIERHPESLIRGRIEEKSGEK